MDAAARRRLRLFNQFNHRPPLFFFFFFLPPTMTHHQNFPFPLLPPPHGKVDFLPVRDPTSRRRVSSQTQQPIALRRQRLLAPAHWQHTAKTATILCEFYRLFHQLFVLFTPVGRRNTARPRACDVIPMTISRPRLPVRWESLLVSAIPRTGID